MMRCPACRCCGCTRLLAVLLLPAAAVCCCDSAPQLLAVFLLPVCRCRSRLHGFTWRWPSRTQGCRKVCGDPFHMAQHGLWYELRRGPVKMGLGRWCRAAPASRFHGFTCFFCWGGTVGSDLGACKNICFSVNSPTGLVPESTEACKGKPPAPSLFSIFSRVLTFLACSST